MHPSHTQHPTPTAIPTPSPVMPRHDRDNEVLCQVLADHGVTQQQLADATGISHSFISRVFAGQYSAPPAVLRALWAYTLDHRVLRVALGDRALDHLVAEPGDQRRALVFQTATTIGLVADGLAKLAAGGGSPTTLRSAMAEASRCMRALDSHLQTATHARPGPAGKVDLCA